MLRLWICAFILLSQLASAKDAGFCETQATAGTTFPLTSLPGKFTLTVWNVHKFSDNRSISDLARLSSQSELVLIQESVLNKIFSGPMQEVGEQMQWAFSSTFSTRDGLTGVVTGSRATVLRSEIVTSEVREPITGTPKAMIFSTVPVEGSEEDMLVVNVHAINFMNLRKFRDQVEQITNRIAQHDGPVIVAGDFNTWNRARRQTLIENLNTLGVELAHSSSGRYLVLDHILTRGLRLVTSYETADVRSSDHAPLMVQLELEKPAALN